MPPDPTDAATRPAAPGRTHTPGTHPNAVTGLPRAFSGYVSRDRDSGHHSPPHHESFVCPQFHAGHLWMKKGKPLIPIAQSQN